MFNFLVHVHLSMFFVLVTAGTICTIWGVGLLILQRRASKTVAIPQEEASEQQATGSAKAGTNNPAGQAKPPISPLFRSAFRITGYLALFQAVLGGILLLMGGAPKDSLHYVYGILVLLAVPVASIYTSDKPEQARRDLIVLLIGALVVAAAAVRAFMTGYP